MLKFQHNNTKETEFEPFEKRRLTSAVLIVSLLAVIAAFLVMSATNSSSEKPSISHSVSHREYLGGRVDTRKVNADANGWVLIARQVTGNWFPKSSFQTGLLNENNPSAPAYCVLANLENYRRNGKFHFRLRWPSLNREQEWKQSLNPFTDRTAPTGNNAVAGYETGTNSPAVNLYWRGLHYDGVGYSFLASRGPWYSVGAFAVWNGGIGGPVINSKGKTVPEVELYVYGGATTTTAAPSQPPTSPPPTCFPCGVMGQYLCDVSMKCKYSANHCRCRDLQTDIAFLVDASGSVKSEGFDFEKQIADTMLFNLPINSRAGVIRFGDGATAVSKLFSGQSIDQVRATVMGMTYQPGENTHMGDAIQMALGTDYFNNPQETRTRLRMVVLTDGISNGGIDLCSLSQQIKGKPGLEVIIVGVTSQFSASAVTCLVSDPGQYIIEVKDLTLNSFATIWGRFDNLICPELVA